VGDVARAVRDLLDRGRSVLILGAPGAGKTTALRSVARALARRRRVLVVDRTGGELAGRSEAPHRAVGDARRLLLEAGAPSHHAMVNALQQFLPEVLVVDNVSGADEARALRCVGEEGVAVIAAARAATLKAVLESPELCGLVGVGPRGPGEAGRLARVRSAVFDACVELSGDCECRVYPALDEAVRALVDEVDPGFELRATSVSGGQVQVFAREMVPRRKRET
jgi:stage III sporulation protein SpoIIIAA